MVGARGATVTDEHGDDYLDVLGGYGALDHGHNHPEIVDAVARVDDSPNVPQASVETLAAGLGETHGGYPSVLVDLLGNVTGSRIGL
jgi:4-aminobutyrate aminotransferase-like enzyme